MYHRIVPASCRSGVSPEEAPYALDEDVFLKHLDLLGRLGFGPVTLERALERWSDLVFWGDHPIVLSFDDGDSTQGDVAWRHLAARDWPGTFFVTSNRIDREDGIPSQRLREMRAAGMEIGTHGATHALLTTLTDAELEGEMRGSRVALGGVLGSPPAVWSAPGGRVDARVLDAADAAGYRAGASSAYGFNTRPTPPKLFERLTIRRGTDAAGLEGLLCPSRSAFALGCARAWAVRTAQRTVGDDRYLRLYESFARLTSRVRRVSA